MNHTVLELDTVFSNIHKVIHTFCQEWPACHQQGVVDDKLHYLFCKQVFMVYGVYGVIDEHTKTASYG